MSIANKREILLPKLISLIDEQNETINNLTSINKILANLLFDLGLELKGNWQVFRFDYGDGKGRHLDFMGFRFYRNRVTFKTEYHAAGFKESKKDFKEGQNNRL